MGIFKSLRRNLVEAPLQVQAWQARRQAAGEPRGTYHLVLPFRAITAYQEHIQGLVECFEAVGRTTVLHPVKRIRQVGKPRPGDRVIFFRPEQLDLFDPVPGVLYAAVNSEPYPYSSLTARWPIERQYTEFLERCDIILESHEALLARARERELNRAGVLPFGYSEHWNWNATPVKPRYDVAFLMGQVTDHRRELWEAIRSRFKVCPRHEAWGRRRIRFLRSARIQLSFSRYEEPHLSGHRFAMALANGCFVLSEPLPPKSPFKAGVHYAEATSASMVDTIARYLDRQEKREQIAAAGREFFTTHYRLEHFVKRVLPIFDFALEAIREGKDPSTVDEPLLVRE
jgi:hypothetical protein